ncbi:MULTISPECIES: CU044_5270 family protein [Streptomyces]|uniref:CU044_5270 family protein n=1 Tax=Streptomyces TaxID=1883 RepID=UPI002249765B|nr:CU044_5270 family protein [Streptomyces sp. JHD 1]MCX2971896.1 CU044_5270 family protein [Streptomyces sp. JHD 1]
MYSLDELVRSADPAKGRNLATEAESEAMLERILATPRRDSARRTRRRPLLMLAAATLTAGTLVTGAGLVLDPAQQQAYAATPPPLHLQENAEASAAEVLEEVAATAERLPSPAIPENAAAHFEREMWSLFTRIDGKQVTSRIVPQHYEIWIRPDGTRKQTIEEDGTTRTTQGSAAGDPSAPEGEGAEAMKRWVLAAGDGSGAGAFFDRYPEKALDRVFTPKQRAALLRAMASFDGVEYNGTVTDRSGRRGAAFSVESDFGGLPSKQTLIIDPATGNLMAYESMLTKDPGELKVKIPAVTQYVTFLKGEYVSNAE